MGLQIHGCYMTADLNANKHLFLMKNLEFVSYRSEYVCE